MNITTFQQQIKNIPYVTKQNLSILINKEGDNLDYWIKKMIENKQIIPIKKGFYVPSYYWEIIKEKNLTERENYLIYLANNIRPPSYVSLEYVLAKYNFLAESVFAITSITLKTTREYSSEVGNFYYKNIKEELFSGYEKESNFQDKIIKEATLAKALFDLLYLKSFQNQTKMTEYLLKLSRFNWDVLSSESKEEFANYIKKSQSNKMETVLKILKTNKKL